MEIRFRPGLVFDVLLTDLAKACLSHELLAAKLSAYGVDISAVRFIYDYLTNWKQRTKIEDHYNSWRSHFWSSSRVNFGTTII